MRPYGRIELLGQLPVNFTKNDVQSSDDRHQVGNHGALAHLFDGLKVDE